jgi:hypothetical protein
MSETNVGTVSRAQTLRVLTAARLPAAPISSPIIEFLGVIGLAAMLLSVALWNGFPMTFYDTGAYILQGMANYFVPERAPVYSYFLRFAGGQESLWWVAATQTGIIAFVMVQFVRAEAPGTTLWRMLGIGAVLCAFTAIAWVSGEIEPDCFTAVVVLSAWLLAFRAAVLGVTRCIVVLAAGALAIASHPSHLGLAGGLVAATAMAWLVMRLKGEKVLVPNPVLPALSLALAVGLILTANYALTKRVFLSRSGPVFMTARMIEDGVAKRVLDDTCPGAGYILCRYKDNLPATADEYLWDSPSPFNRLGRFRGSAKESQAIMIEGFRRYPLLEFAQMLKNGARQFLMFRTGDGIGPQERVLDTEFRNFLPRQMKAYSTARQQREEFSFVLLNVLHVGLAALAILVLGFVAWSQRQSWKDVALPGFVLLALAGNALVCGALSGPHDRYQGRLVWVAVFVVVLTAKPALLALRRRVESGT